jgi:hypothetical protein
MLELYALQIFTGVAAGWAAEYLERTRSDSSEFSVRWMVLIAAFAASIAYAFALGCAMNNSSVADLHHVAAAVALCAFGLISYLVRKAKLRSTGGPKA